MNPIEAVVTVNSEDSPALTKRKQIERLAGFNAPKSPPNKKAPFTRYKSSTGIKFKSYVDVKEIVTNSVLMQRLSYK